MIFQCHSHISALSALFVCVSIGFCAFSFYQFCTALAHWTLCVRRRVQLWQLRMTAAAAAAAGLVRDNWLIALRMCARECLCVWLCWQWLTLQCIWFDTISFAFNFIVIFQFLRFFSNCVSFSSAFKYDSLRVWEGVTAANDVDFLRFTSAGAPFHDMRPILCSCQPLLSGPSSLASDEPITYIFPLINPPECNTSRRLDSGEYEMRASIGFLLDRIALNGSAACSHKMNKFTFIRHRGSARSRGMAFCIFFFCGNYFIIFSCATLRAGRQPQHGYILNMIISFSFRCFFLLSGYFRHNFVESLSQSLHVGCVRLCIAYACSLFTV